MSIIREHIDFYREIFLIKNFWKEPFLMIGLPIMEGSYMPEDFNFKNLKELLISRGLREIKSLDLFDPKADIKHDLNKPIQRKYHNKFRVVADFGTIEHIFDTKQCLDNYIRMLETGGLLVLLTNINGYYGHGLHVFSPEGLVQALKLNGFEIVHKVFTSSTGVKVKDPSVGKNVLIWLVAEKRKKVNIFKSPQQTVWQEVYKKYKIKHIKKTVIGDLLFLYRETKRKMINKLPEYIRNNLYGR